MKPDEARRQITELTTRFREASRELNRLIAINADLDGRHSERVQRINAALAILNAAPALGPNECSPEAALELAHSMHLVRSILLGTTIPVRPVARPALDICAP